MFRRCICLRDDIQSTQRLLSTPVWFHPSIHLYIHPSMHPFFEQLIPCRVAVSLESITGAMGQMERDTLNKVQVHRRAKSHTTVNSEMAISLKYMSLDWGRKLRYLEETLKAEEENANFTYLEQESKPGGKTQLQTP